MAENNDLQDQLSQYRQSQQAFQDIDREIQDRVNAIQNLQNYDTQTLVGIGAKYIGGPYALQQQQIQQAGTDLFGNPIASSQFDRATLQNQLETQLNALRQQREVKGGTYRNQALSYAKAQQQSDLKALSEARSQFNSAIDKELANLLDQTGFRADTGRMQVGAALSGRGLGRSTAATEAIGGVNLAEQQQRAQIKSNAYGLQQRALRTEEQTKRQVERQQEQMQLNFDLSKLSSYEDLGFQINVNDINQQFQEELAQLQLDAQSSDLLGAFIGGVLGAGVGAAVGGPVGGLLGFSGGSQFGASL